MNLRGKVEADDLAGFARDEVRADRVRWVPVHRWKKQTLNNSNQWMIDLHSTETTQSLQPHRTSFMFGPGLLLDIFA